MAMLFIGGAAVATTIVGASLGALWKWSVSTTETPTPVTISMEVLPDSTGTLKAPLLGPTPKDLAEFNLKYSKVVQQFSHRVPRDLGRAIRGFNPITLRHVRTRCSTDLLATIRAFDTGALQHRAPIVAPLARIVGFPRSSLKSIRGLTPPIRVVSPPSVVSQIKTFNLTSLRHVVV